MIGCLFEEIDGKRVDAHLHGPIVDDEDAQKAGRQIVADDVFRRGELTAAECLALFGVEPHPVIDISDHPLAATPGADTLAAAGAKEPAAQKARRAERWRFTEGDEPENRFAKHDVSNEARDRDGRWLVSSLPEHIIPQNLRSSLKPSTSLLDGYEVPHLATLVGDTPLFHQTDTKGAKGILERVEAGPRWHDGVYASPQSHLALGQKGSGVTLEFDPKLTNGVIPRSLPNQILAATNGGIAEVVIDKTVRGAVTAIHASSAKALSALAKVPRLAAAFDFNAATATKFGLTVLRYMPKFETTGDLAKMWKTLEPMWQTPASEKTSVSRYRKVLTRAFQKTGPKVAGAVRERLKKAERGELQKNDIGDDDLPLDDISDAADDLAEVSSGAAREVARGALARVGVGDDEGMVNRVSARAVAQARARAAELVGKSWDEETQSFVDNPDPDMAITDSTRAMIRDIIANGLQDNLSADEIADQIETSTAFSPERADLVAKTEIARVNSDAALTAYQDVADNGVPVKKRWIIAAQDVCDDCTANAKQGAIDLDEAFQSGDQSPPQHPNCRCTISPVVVSNDGEETGDESNDEEVKGDESNADE